MGYRRNPRIRNVSYPIAKATAFRIYMGKSQNLGMLVCGGVSYTQMLSFHMILSYSRVSTVPFFNTSDLNEWTGAIHESCAFTTCPEHTVYIHDQLLKSIRYCISHFLGSLPYYFTAHGTIPISCHVSHHIPAVNTN